MKKLFIILFAVLVLACTRSETPKIPDVCRLSALVTDTLGNALPHASVEMTRADGTEPRSAVTDANGAFEFDNLHAGTYDLLIEKDGYTSWHDFVKVTKAQTDIAIHLERLPAVIDIEAQPEELDFGADSDTLLLLISPKLRENIEWSVKIADNSWLKAAPTSGTLTADSDIEITFIANRETITETTAQVISILVGTTALPVTARIEPANPTVDNDTPSDTPTDSPEDNDKEDNNKSDDKDDENVENVDYLYFTPDSAAYGITPPVIDCKKWAISFKAKIDNDGNIFWVKSSTHSSDTEGVSQSLTAENNTFKYLHSEYDNRFHYTDAKTISTSVIGDGCWHNITISGYYTAAQTSYVTIDFYIDDAHIGTIRTLHDESKTAYHGKGITLYIGGARTVNYAHTLPSATFSISDIKLSAE